MSPSLRLSITIRPRVGYMLTNLAHSRGVTGDVPRAERDAVPAGGARNPALGRLRASYRPALRPVREVLAALAPGRVLPFAPGNSRKRGPELSHRGQSLGECRSGAPEGERAPTFGALPRPAHCRTVTSGSVARTLVGCASRRSASLGLLAERANESNKPRARARRENEFLLSAPAKAGEGNHAKHGGGGVSIEASVAVHAPPTAQTRGPASPLSRDGMKSAAAQ